MQVVDIPTDHPSCSRQHCALVHRPDGAIMLVDLDSAHGTFLGDGTRLAANDPAVMEIGKPFKVGGSSRTYIIRKGALADEQAARPGPPRKSLLGFTACQIILSSLTLTTNIPCGACYVEFPKCLVDVQTFSINQEDDDIMSQDRILTPYTNRRVLTLDHISCIICNETQ